MELKENLGVHDGIYGHVIIRNDKDEIIVDKDNMILEEGKNFIAGLILSQLEVSSVVDNVDYKNYGKQQLKYILFFNDEKETTYNFKFDKLNDAIETKKYLTKINNDICAFNKKDDGKLYLKFSIGKITFSGDSSYDLINSCGLVLENGNEYSLFSRIKFDTIVLTNSNSFKLDYYVYF